MTLSLPAFIKPSLKKSHADFLSADNLDISSANASLLHSHGKHRSEQSVYQPIQTTKSTDSLARSFKRISASVQEHQAYARARAPYAQTATLCLLQASQKRMQHQNAKPKASHYDLSNFVGYTQYYFHKFAYNLTGGLRAERKVSTLANRAFLGHEDGKTARRRKFKEYALGMLSTQDISLRCFVGSFLPAPLAWIFAAVSLAVADPVIQKWMDAVKAVFQDHTHQKPKPMGITNTLSEERKTFKYLHDELHGLLQRAKKMEYAMNHTHTHTLSQQEAYDALKTSIKDCSQRCIHAFMQYRGTNRRFRYLLSSNFLQNVGSRTSFVVLGGPTSAALSSAILPNPQRLIRWGVQTVLNGFDSIRSSRFTRASHAHLPSDVMHDDAIKLHADYAAGHMRSYSAFKDFLAESLKEKALASSNKNYVPHLHEDTEVAKFLFDPKKIQSQRKMGYEGVFSAIDMIVTEKLAKIKYENTCLEKDILYYEDALQKTKQKSLVHSSHKNDKHIADIEKTLKKLEEKKHQSYIMQKYLAKDFLIFKEIKALREKAMYQILSPKALQNLEDDIQDALRELTPNGEVLALLGKSRIQLVKEYFKYDVQKPSEYMTNSVLLAFSGCGMSALSGVELFGNQATLSHLDNMLFAAENQPDGMQKEVDILLQSQVSTIYGMGAFAPGFMMMIRRFFDNMSHFGGWKFQDESLAYLEQKAKSRHIYLEAYVDYQKQKVSTPITKKEERKLQYIENQLKETKDALDMIQSLRLNTKNFSQDTEDASVFKDNIKKHFSALSMGLHGNARINVHHMHDQWFDIREALSNVKKSTLNFFQNIYYALGNMPHIPDEVKPQKPTGIFSHKYLNTNASLVCTLRKDDKNHSFKIKADYSAMHIPNTFGDGAWYLKALELEYARIPKNDVRAKSLFITRLSKFQHACLKDYHEQYPQYFDQQKPAAKNMCQLIENQKKFLDQYKALNNDYGMGDQINLSQLAGQSYYAKDDICIDISKTAGYYRSNHDIIHKPAGSRLAFYWGKFYRHGLVQNMRYITQKLIPGIMLSIVNTPLFMYEKYDHANSHYKLQETFANLISLKNIHLNGDALIDRPTFLLADNMRHLI